MFDLEFLKQVNRFHQSYLDNLSQKETTKMKLKCYFNIEKRSYDYVSKKSQAKSSSIFIIKLKDLKKMKYTVISSKNFQDKN